MESGRLDVIRHGLDSTLVRMRPATRSASPETINAGQQANRRKDGKLDCDRKRFFPRRQVFQNG